MKVEEMYYKIDADELEKFFNEKLAQSAVDAFLNNFNNILVSAEEVANYHSINVRTLYNYILDGLIEPEFREKEGGTYKFRLSYALRLNFKELRKQLKLRGRTASKATHY